MAPQKLDRVLEKLAKDVENAVHALYRGEARQQTSRTRTVAMVREAQAATAMTPNQRQTYRKFQGVLDSLRGPGATGGLRRP